jgi:succinate dehydrogenase / fumarate reductase cytochrome b subunit
MANATKTARPLSPHLGIYRWQLTMALSILHRATGVALGAGTLLLTWWLIAAASGPDAYANVQAVLGHILGQFVLIGFTWALFFHLCNGLRHFVWDFGYGFLPKTAAMSGMIVLAAATVLTVLAWTLAFTLH